MTKDRKIGLAFMIVSFTAFGLLFQRELSQYGGDTPPPEIFCSIALIAALTAGPGYILSVMVLLVRHSIRPSFLFCMALTLMEGGLLLFAFSCRSAEYGSLMQVTGILCGALGFPSTWPFFRDVLSRY